MGTITNELMSP